MKEHQLLQLNDEKLMELFCKGNRVAFDTLYRRYFAKLLYFIRQSLKIGEEDAKDVLHDLFMKLIDNKHKFSSDKKFSVWIYTIASNHCKNCIKRKVIENKANKEIALTYDLLSSPFEKNDNLGVIKTAIAELSPKHKQVFLLKYNYGFSIKEVAGILNISEGTVKSRLHYCIQNLGKKKEIKALKY